MSPSSRFSLLSALLLATLAGSAEAQVPAGAPASAPAPLPQPQLGDMAPDFTLPGATRAGLAAPVKLSDLRGQTVVLAFFPRARTSGCTVQMKAYRDQYGTLFKGNKVHVIAISTDADTTLAAWAKELDTPVTFASDSAGSVGRAYGALREGARGKVDMRHLYLVGPDGRIAHKMVPFNELAADSYTELSGAIEKAAGH